MTTEPARSARRSSDRSRLFRGLGLVVPGAVFLAAFFLVPLGIIAVQSVTDAADPLGNYRDLAGSVLLRRALRVTFEMALWTVAVCVVVGYVMAYRLSQLSPRTARLLLVVITFPAWTAVLGRLYAWTIVLGRRGPINDWLTKSGIAEDPLPLLFNRGSAILGLIHILLPYAVLVLYASMRRIDPGLVDASRSLGAGWWTSFRRVLWPATLPGVVAAAVLVFVLAIGNYATPAVLGGAREHTLAIEVIRLAQVRDWGQAVAVGASLLIATTILLAVAVRALRSAAPTTGGSRASALAVQSRRSPSRYLLDAVLFGGIFFLIVPLLVVFPISVTPSTYFRFPPDGFSLRWYEDFFGVEEWRRAAWLSLRLALTSSFTATVLALAAAFATTRYVHRGGTAVRALFMAPLIVPLVITSTAVLFILVKLGFESTSLGIFLGHVVIGIPFAFIVIESALRSYDTSLEDAAVTLGANRLRAFRSITLPAILPAVVAGAAFAFIASWDDVVVVVFVGNFETQTLPLRMLEFMTTQIRPTIAAVSSLLITTIFVAAAGLVALAYRRDRRHSGAG